jgi:hypothetical protein
MPTLFRFGNSRLGTVHEFTVDPSQLAGAEMEIPRIVIHYTIRTSVRKSWKGPIQTALTVPGIPPPEGVSD